MKTTIGTEQAANQFIKAMLLLRPSISINGNKLNMTHKGKQFTVPLTKVYASKAGLIR